MLFSNLYSLVVIRLPRIYKANRYKFLTCNLCGSMNIIISEALPHIQKKARYFSTAAIPNSPLAHHKFLEE